MLDSVHHSIVHVDQFIALIVSVVALPGAV
jgi:hypothetical protein